MFVCFKMQVLLNGKGVQTVNDSLHSRNLTAGT